MKKCHVVIGFSKEHPEGKAIAITGDRKDAVDAFEKARDEGKFEFIGFTRLARWEKRSKPAEDADRAKEREKRLKNAAIEGEKIRKGEDPGPTPKEDIAAAIEEPKTPAKSKK